MQITITIDLGNEAMQTPEDVVDAVTRTMLRSQNVSRVGALTPGDFGHLTDFNGNAVGRWEVTA